MEERAERQVYERVQDDTKHAKTTSGERGPGLKEKEKRAKHNGREGERNRRSTRRRKKRRKKKAQTNSSLL